MTKLQNKIIDIFFDLIRFDTASDPYSKSFPSTEALSNFAEYLAGKLASMGFENIRIDDHSYVTAFLPSNTDKDCPAVGFIAHTDTSPDYNGKMIKPLIHENYDGKDIVLKNGVILSPDEFPFMKNYIGQSIITSDGTTLLGADDKAGITEIICALKYFIDNPQIKHGNVKIAFTPDEEIGRGVDFFSTEDFACDLAYTIDGGELGEFSYENFNAAHANVLIKGKNVHPGSAKGIMKNSALIACEFVSMLPEKETPAKTDGYEGFFHLCDFKGNVSETKLEFIIRDFDKISFENRKELMKKITADLNKKYGENTVVLEMDDSYYNMKEIIDKYPSVKDIAVEAIRLAGVEPKILPTRGGTDGCWLSFDGLPCPNIFTGGHNFHGPYELVVPESMEKAVRTIINIILIIGGNEYEKL